MDFKFGKDAEKPAPRQTASGEKGRQNALLLLLLVLVCGYSYLYFFTGLIRPQQAPKPVEAPAPQVIKKPLPVHDGQPKAEAPAADGEKKETVAAPGKAEPATAPAAPANMEAQKTQPSKPAEQKAAPAPVPQTQKQVAAAKPETKPAAAPSGKKPAPADAGKKGAGLKATEKTKHSPAGETKASKAAAPQPEKKTAAGIAAGGGKWTVVVGNYILEDAMVTDLARVRKAGFKAFVQPGARKKAPMNRLFLAEFDNRSTAQAELEKLKRYTSDAFILDQGGTYAVYAGSYLLDSRTASEKERLTAAGLPVAVKHVEVSITYRNLTAGPFADKGAAEAAVRKLKEAGLGGAFMRQ